MTKTKTISFKVSKNVYREIEHRMDLLKVNRSQAITLAILNSKIIAVKEGPQLVALLHRIEGLLIKSDIMAGEKTCIRKVCDDLWQLLSLITEKIQRETEE